jgi:hypothetical protein
MLSLGAYDLLSGFIHVILDHPPYINAPLYGQACLEFQWHHHLPHDIVTKGLAASCADLSLAIISVGVTTFAIYGFGQDECLYAACLIMSAYYGQWSHFSSHAVGKDRSSIARKLQRVGLLISAKQHHKHHSGKHDTTFCLIGWFDPVVQWFFDNTSPILWCATLDVSDSPGHLDATTKVQPAITERQHFSRFL